MVPELDRKLSCRAAGIADVLCGLALATAALETFLQGPVATVLIRFQAVYLFEGEYYPLMTIIALGFLYCVPAYAVAFGWDYATEQGTFAQSQADPSAAADAHDESSS